MPNLLQKTLAVLGSFWVASVTLILLLVVTFFGTLEQARTTIYDVQTHYFQSAWVFHQMGGAYPLLAAVVLVLTGVAALGFATHRLHATLSGSDRARGRPITLWQTALILLAPPFAWAGCWQTAWDFYGRWQSGAEAPLPLLGGYLLMVVLVVNLVVGGIVRVSWKPQRLGVLIAHVGIVLLFLGAFVEDVTADKGMVQLWEPRPGQDARHLASSFVSQEEWEVVVAGPGENEGEQVEFVIPHHVFAKSRRRARCRHDSLPFDVILDGYLRNARLRGDALEKHAPVSAVEAKRLRNLAGVHVTLEGPGATGANRGALSPLREEPFRATFKGKTFTVALRERSWSFPFRLALDDFVHEVHPGTGIPREFSSHVTVSEQVNERIVARKVKITMNEPLRYRGLTLYQSGWGPQDPRELMRHRGRQYTVLSVVQGPTDHLPFGLPYSAWACIVIGVGLLWHYVVRLECFLRGEAARRAALGVGVVLVLLLGTATTARAYDDEEGGAPRSVAPEAPAWPEEAVDAFAHVAVQSGGRVMPLWSWADVKLLQLNYRKTCRVPKDGNPKGRKLSSVEWMLDVMFRPEIARTYRCFLVETRDVVTSIGVDVEGRKKRDRYSYAEIAVGRKALFALAEGYHQTPEKDLAPIEGGILALKRAVEAFEGISHFLDFARAPVGGEEGMPYSQVAAQAADFVRAEMEARDRGAGEETAGFGLLRQADLLASESGIFHLFPTTPAQIEALRARKRSTPNPERWLSPRDVVVRSAQTPTVPVAEAHVAMLADFEALVAAVDDPDAFRDAAKSIRDYSYVLTGDFARAFEEDDHVGLEVFLFRDLKPFFRARWLFFLPAALLVAISWLLAVVSTRRPRWLDLSLHLLTVSIWTLLAFGSALVIWGIWIRSMLRGHPPVTSLYETVLFIAAFAVVACLVIEALTRKRIALALAPILGVLLLFLASRYEMMDKKDSLYLLPAVLDTNFWLATHVIFITLGYGASILAAIIAHLYVLGRVFGLGKNDQVFEEAFYDTIHRMVFGVLGFALLTSVVGTILGGVWANDSWGRFWGWDPKENGALMIVLWQLAMLHASLGRYIKPFGFNVAAIVLAGIVSFSWWGVNQLQIGLHTYGFSSGVMSSLLAFYGFQVAVLFAAAAWRLLDADWWLSVSIGVLAAIVYAWLIWRDLSVVAWIVGGSAFVLGVAVLIGALLSGRESTERAPVPSD